MTLPYDVQYRLLQRGWMLAAEVPATEPDRRAWVSVFYDGADERPFVVRYVEIHRHWLNPGDDITQDHAAIYEKFQAKDEDELVALLHRWLSDLNQLIDPEIAEHPL